jgi:hypothetical protein
VLRRLPLTLVTDDDRRMVFRFDRRPAYYVGGVNVVMWGGGAFLQARADASGVALLCAVFALLAGLLIVQYWRRTATFEIDKRTQRLTFRDVTDGQHTAWERPGSDVRQVVFSSTDEQGIEIRLLMRQGDEVRIRPGVFTTSRKRGHTLVQDVARLLDVSTAGTAAEAALPRS